MRPAHSDHDAVTLLWPSFDGQRAYIVTVSQVPHPDPYHHPITTLY